MCRARYKFSYRARTAGAARCLPPDREASVHSGDDLVQPCIGARRSVPMADSDGAPGGAAEYASVSPRSPSAEIGRVPRRDRFTSGSRSVHFRAEIGPVPHRDRFTSAPRSGRGVRRASLPPGKWCFRAPLAPRSLDLHHIWRRTGRLCVLEGVLQPAPTVGALLPGAPYGPPLLHSSRRVTDPGAVIGVGQGPGDWRGFAVRTGRRGEMKARGAPGSRGGGAASGHSVRASARRAERERTFPTPTYLSPILLTSAPRRMGERYVHVTKLR